MGLGQGHIFGALGTPLTTLTYADDTLTWVTGTLGIAQRA